MLAGIGEYASFGMVIEGMDEVDKIVKTPVDYRDKPYAEQIIKSVTVETFEVDYGEVQKA
jgi:peptidyl-prolyl cis-trans isomerase B (cyclophilin B)